MRDERTVLNYIERELVVREVNRTEQRLLGAVQGPRQAPSRDAYATACSSETVFDPEVEVPIWTEVKRHDGERVLPRSNLCSSRGFCVTGDQEIHS